MKKKKNKENIFDKVCSDENMKEGIKVIAILAGVIAVWTSPFWITSDTFRYIIRVAILPITIILGIFLMVLFVALVGLAKNKIDGKVKTKPKKKKPKFKGRSNKK